MLLLGKQNVDFATQPYNTGKNYSFLDSRELITRIEKASDYVHLGTSWSTVKKNKELRQGAQKHLMVFGRDDQEGPRMLVINDHEGKTALRFQVGFYRKACANGLIAGDTFFMSRYLHKGVNILEDSVQEAVAATRQITDVVANLRDCKVDEAVDNALRHSLEEVRNHELTNVELLPSRRAEDRIQDLWTRFNVVQEYGIKGGYNYWSTGGNNQRHIRRARSIKSIRGQVEINKKLFDTAMGLMHR